MFQVYHIPGVPALPCVPTHHLSCVPTLSPPNQCSNCIIRVYITYIPGVPTLSSLEPSLLVADCRRWCHGSKDKQVRERSMEVKLPALLGNYDCQTDRPMDRLGHQEVSFQDIYIHIWGTKSVSWNGGSTPPPTSSIEYKYNVKLLLTSITFLLFIFLFYNKQYKVSK